MRTALSMYLGGDTIQSNECDHSTAKDFGLVCPVCHEPVIYCSGSDRASKKGTSYQVKPYFSHYSKNLSNSVCELRMKTDPQTCDRIKKEAKQGHQQRINLYNKRLWDIYSYYHVDNQKVNAEMKNIKLMLGKKELGRFAESMINIWSLPQNIENFHKFADNAARISHEHINSICDRLVTENLGDPTQMQFYKDMRNYRTDITKKALHFKITHEVMDFLTTKTSKHFWKCYLVRFVHLEFFRKGLTLGSLNNYTFDQGKVADHLLRCLANTRWVDAIAEFI